MFRPNTLFVLGAASSLDFGFPLGKELKKIIAGRLKFPRDEWGQLEPVEEESRNILRALTQSEAPEISQQDFFKAAEMIRKGVGLASSIDNFLEMRKAEPGLAICAKTTIASIILEIEQKIVELRYDKLSRGHAASFDGKWHQQFAQICFEDVTQGDLPEALSRVSIISFNYDRSFEQFVRVAMMQLYALEWNAAVELSNHLVVTHPYGSLSALPGSNQMPVLEFGLEQVNNLLPIAKQIKTFTERVTEQNTLLAISRQIQKAETMVFLGFGYHKQNVDLLDPKTLTKVRQIFGTAVGVASAAREDVVSRLEIAFRRKHSNGDILHSMVKLENMDCLKLLEEYSLALQDK